MTASAAHVAATGRRYASTKRRTARVAGRNGLWLLVDPLMLGHCKCVQRFSTRLSTGVRATRRSALREGNQAGVGLLLVDDAPDSDLEPFEEPEDPEELLADSDFDSVDAEPSLFVSDWELEAFTVDDVEESALRLSLR